MKKTAINILALAVIALVMAVNVGAVKAAPRLTLTPVNGSFTNGSTFTVSIGVNSETSKSSAVDVWGTFDASKLKIISIVKSANPPFPFDMTPAIDNTSGKFDFSCASTNMSSFDNTVINGELAVVTFQALNTGTANLNFVCTSGLTNDSNIFEGSNDVISCSANSSGSYTINSSDSSSTTATSTPTPTTSSTSTVTATELPKTGGVSSTIGLIVFGAISLASVLFLKFL